MKLQYMFEKCTFLHVDQIFPLDMSSHEKAEHAPTCQKPSAPCENPGSALWVRDSASTHVLMSLKLRREVLAEVWRGTPQHIQVGSEIVIHTPMKADHPSMPILRKHNRLTPEIQARLCWVLLCFYPPQGA